MLSLTVEALAPQAPWAQVLVVIAIVGIGVVLTFTIRARIARRNAEQPSPRELIEQLKASRQRSDDVHTLSGELLDTAQRLGAQLDNKARHLESLIERADQRIAALSSSPAAIPPPLEGGEPAPRAPAPPGQLDPLTRAVYEHTDAGLHPVEIARRLDEQVGKIELILALRER